jgi:hypothetical protein
MGKVLVRDDGTSEVNGYCTSNEERIATQRRPAMDFAS